MAEDDAFAGTSKMIDGPVSNDTNVSNINSQTSISMLSPVTAQGDLLFHSGNIEPCPESVVDQLMEPMGKPHISTNSVVQKIVGTLISRISNISTIAGENLRAHVDIKKLTPLNILRVVNSSRLLASPEDRGSLIFSELQNVLLIHYLSGIEMNKNNASILDIIENVNFTGIDPSDLSHFLNMKGIPVNSFDLYLQCPYELSEIVSSYNGNGERPEDDIKVLTHPSLPSLLKLYRDLGGDRAIPDRATESSKPDLLYLLSLIRENKFDLVVYLLSHRQHLYNSYDSDRYECPLGVAQESNRFDIIDLLLKNDDIIVHLPQVLRRLRKPKTLSDLLYSRKISSVSTNTRRKSIGGQATDLSDIICTQSLGYYFQFVNRDPECDQLFTAILDLEGHRVSCLDWDIVKRAIRIPVVVGMPGLGKTRFARDAILHKFEKLKKLSESIYDIIMREVENEKERNLALSLAYSCYHNLNIRVECKGSLKCGDFAKAILVEWARGSDVANLVQDMAPSFSIEDAIAFLIRWAKIVSKYNMGDKEPSIIINLDEAHHAESSVLSTVLIDLFQCLAIRKFRVFVIISGLKNSVINAGVNGSMMKGFPIFLPTLTIEHSITILNSFFRSDSLSKAINSSDPKRRFFLKHLLWWLGGVPRFLEFFVNQLAISYTNTPKPTEFSRKEALNYLLDLVTDTSRFGSFLDGINNEVCPYCDYSLLDTIINYSITGVEVELALSLNPHITVEGAQSKDLLYWKNKDKTSSFGKIVIPPLLLYHYYHRACSPPKLIFFSKLDPVLTPRDSEALVITILMRKLKCFRHNGNASVLLSNLGITKEGAEDIVITIPTNLEVGTTRKMIQSETFNDFYKTIDKDSLRAWCNIGTAHFPDAFIILDDLFIFIQEKQSIVNKQHNLGIKGSAAVCIKKGNVMEEYNKISAEIRKKRHIFLYVTDCNSRSDEKYPKEVFVFTPKEHNILLGDLFSYLRESSIAASIVDFPQELPKKKTDSVSFRTFPTYGENILSD